MGKKVGLINIGIERERKGFPNKFFFFAYKIKLIISKDDIVWRCLNERCRIKMIKVNRHDRAVVHQPVKQNTGKINE